MRSQLVIVSAVLAAACGGRATTSGSAPAPAARTATAPAEPTSVRFAPGSIRYRLEQQQSARQEMAGNVQESEATSTMQISAVVAPGEGGNLAAAFTVDSVSVTSSAPGASAQLEALRGKTFRSVVTPMGKAVSFTPPDSTPMGLMSGEMFREFFPSLPSGTLSSGMTWTDTVVAPPQQVQGLTLRTTSIRNHRVVGWEDRDGARALHITTNGAYSMSGEGEQGGTPLTLTGTGLATSERFVSAAGLFVGGNTTDSTNLMVTAPAMGLEIPIRQVRRTTLTRLP